MSFKSISIINLYKVSFLIGIGITLSPDIYAQSNTSEEVAVSSTIGPYMLSKVPRVKEIIPFAGVRLSLPWGSFRPEILAIHGRGLGITYYRVFLSLRNKIQIPGMNTSAQTGIEAMKLFWTTGIHYDQYQQSPFPTGQITPFKQRGGIHFGFGIHIPFGRSFRFRTDFYMNVKPGLGFFLGGGFEIPFGGHSDKT